MQTEPRRLDVKGAAIHCGISVSLLNRLRQQGKGPAYYKLGERVVYDTTELDTWLERHRVREAEPMLRPEEEQLC